MNRYLAITLCAAAFLFAASSAAWATTYPAYTCSEVVGIASGTQAKNATGESLMANGSVYGESIVPGTTVYYLCSWSPTGTLTEIDNAGSSLWASFGDASGQIAASLSTTFYIWNGTSLVLTGNSNLGAGSGIDFNGMSPNGLCIGDHAEKSPEGTGWAYDLNTSTYYSIGPTGTFAISGNSSGNVVGQDGSGNKGFIWNEGTQSYSTIPSLNFAWGISQNSQLVAGENQSGQAAVYNTSTTSTSTYWTGEATFVNDNGLVVGDTNTGFYYYGYGAQAMAEIGGQQVNLTTAYAPGGVTFNYCEGVNDAGQILVWSLGANGGGTTNRTFLLTPVVVPEPSTLLLSAMGLLGLLAYAWRKRK